MQSIHFPNRDFDCLFAFLVVVVCVCKYTCMHVCIVQQAHMHASVCVCMCEGQMTILKSSVTLHLGRVRTSCSPLCTQAGLSASMWSPGAVSHIHVSTCGRQRSASALSLCGFRDVTLDPHSYATHTVRALPTGPSPQPESYLSITNYHKRPLLLCTQEQRKMQMQMTTSYCGRTGGERRLLSLCRAMC